MYNLLITVTKTIDSLFIGFVAIVIGFDLLAAFSGIILLTIGISFSVLQELPRLSMSCIAFLGLAAALRSGQHISVDALLVKLKGRVRTIFEIFIYLIICFASVFLFWSSLETTLYLKEVGLVVEGEWEFPQWYLYLFQLVGFTLLFFYSLTYAVVRAIHLINPRFGPDTAPLTGASTE